MRRHGWQLPYHPLQIVAVAVFLALAFAFYVFFVPFVGKKQFEYVVMGLYTPLVICVFSLYVWCAAADPGDPGVFKSKKYLNMVDNKRHTSLNKSRRQSISTTSMNDANAVIAEDKPRNEEPTADASGQANELAKENPSCSIVCCFQVLLGWCPLSFLCSQSHLHERSSEQQSEDGMFYCSLCEVEVDQQLCRKKKLQKLFHPYGICAFTGIRGLCTLGLSLQLILQWSIGVLVLIRCFLKRKLFTVDIESKLGSSFSLVPFLIVMGLCTFLAMVATLPLAQLFFFHVLLIKKGISTYDYIIALREREQQGTRGQQSLQMSPISSLTGLSSASSFTNFHQGAWCTPPRLFLEDQFDFVPLDISMPSSSMGKKALIEESRKRNPGTVKISPWTLARLNAEEVSKAAALAKKKSSVLQPVTRRENMLGQEIGRSFGRGNDRTLPRIDKHKKSNKRGRLLADLPLEPLTKISASATDSNGSDHTPEISSTLVPLQVEARSAFCTRRGMSSTGIVASSPDSSLGSPDLHPCQVSSSGAEQAQGLTSLPSIGSATQKGVQLSRSTSDGYEASGGEDSDRVPSRIVHRSSNWDKLLLSSGRGEIANELNMLSSGGLHPRMWPY